MRSGRVTTRPVRIPRRPPPHGSKALAAPPRAPQRGGNPFGAKTDFKSRVSSVGSPPAAFFFRVSDSRHARIVSQNHWQPQGEPATPLNSNHGCLPAILCHYTLLQPSIRNTKKKGSHIRVRTLARNRLRRGIALRARTCPRAQWGINPHFAPISSPPGRVILSALTATHPPPVARWASCVGGGVLLLNPSRIVSWLPHSSL